MNFPDNVKFAKSHEWLRVEGKEGVIGISDFAQSELGDIVFVDVTAQEGDELKAGEVFGTIEAVKTVSDLYMPATGKIIAINQVIVDSPETINNDPYGDGWMVRIEITSAGDTDSLMQSSDYAQMVGKAH
jgi:glycine cleavage system H protein